MTVGGECSLLRHSPITTNCVNFSFHDLSGPNLSLRQRALTFPTPWLSCLSLQNSRKGKAQACTHTRDFLSSAPSLLVLPRLEESSQTSKIINAPHKDRPPFPSRECGQWTVLPSVVQPTVWQHQYPGFAQVNSVADSYKLRANVYVKFPKKAGNILSLGF